MKFLLIVLCLLLFSQTSHAKEKRCAKCCSTSVSFLGYLPNNFKVRLATKEGLKEFDIKVTKKYSDGNFDYDIEKIGTFEQIGEVDSLIGANGLVGYTLVNFTLPVITNYQGQDYLESWDCQAVISAEPFWKGDCTAIGFDKFGKLEFVLAPLTLERK